jgi:integrase
MASVSVTRRRKKGGTRYVVRYRLGGRAYPIVHGGSFDRERDAKTRRDFIAGELAGGRDPRIALRELLKPQVRRTLHQEFERFMASRVDVGVKAQALYGNARDRLRSLASLEPTEITYADVQEWIAENSKASDEFRALSPKSLGHYLSTLRQVLDFCDVIPNPARSPKVKLPEQHREEVAPPSQSEWRTILRSLPEGLRLVCRFIECEGVRISEALKLRVSDFLCKRVRAVGLRSGF